MPHFRFGLFDFDPSANELRREGIPVRLQSQPAQVLALLLQNAGDVVTRDALRNAIWGTETFVDFDRGLNFCVAQVRSALGDSADSPRFIRTVPKRGYQFIAPTASSVPVPIQTKPARRPRIAVPAIAGLGLLATFGFYLWNSRRPAITPPIPSVAVARFDNETGSADFDGFADGLTDAVVSELTTSGTGHYQVIGNAAILRVPRSARDLTAIASALKVSYIVLGQVQGGSSGVRVLAHLIRMPDQTHLWVTRLDRNPANPLDTELEIAQRIGKDFFTRLKAASPRRATN